MEKLSMTPVFSRKSILFLCLGVFALLFLGAQSVSAATCSSYGGNPNWQRGGNPSIDNCTAVYTDPVGGSNLTVCQYRVLSNGVPTTPSSPGLSDGWRNDAVGACSGSSATLSIDISIGAGLNCRDDGENKCEVQFKAEDNSGNSATGTIVTLDVDYTVPGTPGTPDITAESDTGFSSTDNITNDTTPTWTWTFTGSPPTSYSVYWGPTPGSLANFASVPTNAFTHSAALAGGTWYMQVKAFDVAGNESAFSGNGSVVIDTTKPEIHAFDVVPKTPAWINAATLNVAVSFEVLDTGGSALQDVEVWRENPTGHTPVGWNKIGTVLASSLTLKSGSTTNYLGSYQDAASNLLDGKTYRYGIHVNDNAANMRTEDDNTPADPYTGGPLSVQVDKTAPTLAQVTAIPSPTNDATPNYTFSSTESSTITYGGDCSSATTAADSGNNTITFNTLAQGSHSNCTITVTDEAGNPSNILSVSSFTIDTIPPSVTMSGAPVAWQNINATVSVGCDALGGSACDSPSYRLKTDTTSGACSTAYGDYTLTSPQTISSHLWVCAVAKDLAGNSGFSPSRVEFKVDTKYPKLETFYADLTVLSIANPTVTISWSASDSGDSALKQGELWRKAPGGSWQPYGDPDTSPSSPNPFTDTPTSDGTYEYGFHVVDNALNCITEGAKRCDTGVDPGDGIPRTIFSPIQVQVDKTVPPKPTCNPAGGTFQNQANNVTCSAEGGTTIRYSLDGSSPSILYSSPFDITSTATLKVASWDPAGNRSVTPDNSYSFTILHNQAPNIQGNPSDSPDPIKATVQITFSADWNDPDGDSVTFFACKNNVTPSGGDCSGGSTNRWCRNLTAVPPGTDAACSYTTAVADAGTKTYYAFVCDDENACSSSKSGTFLVDATAPTITTFTITPQSPSWANNASPSVTVTWNVSDQGGSHLDRVRAYRAPFGSGCDDSSKTSCVWVQAGSDAIAPNNSDNWNCGATCNDRIIDSPGSGTWWYGMHVLDKVQNETAEPAPPGPKKALVDTVNPSTAITSPAAATWFNNNFDATFDDSDTGGSGLATGASGCQYRFIGDNPSGQDTSSGDLTRQCDPVIKSITVGVSPDVCRFEGSNRCRVETQSFDGAGNTSGWQAVLFGVDFTLPIVGSPVPSSVQSGVSTNYSATLRDPIGKVTGCGFYWRAVGSGTWNTGAATTINPIPCENNANCTVSVDHTFASTGSYETQFGCTDQATNTGWGGVATVQVGSLSVDLSAVPSSGSVNTLFDLVATVSGTMTGNISYKFDCTNNGTWELEVNNQTQNPYTALDLCQYASPSTYTAKVFVQRGVGTAEDTQSIVVSSNSIPTTTNRSVDAPNSVDYCGVTGYPPVRVRWTFSDADPGDTQGAYELEVFEGGVTKVVDTGKKLGATQSYVFQSAGEQLLWGTMYTWQVRVWDSPNDDVSTFATGPQFTTPSHYYPASDFTWTPALPGAQESVQFTDQTNFAMGSTGKTWSWTFGDGGSSTTQNPSHTYSQTGAFGVTLLVGDNVGSCSTQKTVNISIPFPEWQEISPF